MLRFVGVFGDIAVSANEEETHCAALRRQRSEVRILSGAPFLASIPAERIAFRPFRIIAGVQMVVHYDEGICSPSLSEARRQFTLEKSPCHRGGDRGKRDTTAVYWGGIPSMFFDRRNLINNFVMPISPGAYKCQYCTWTLHKMQC